MHFSNHKREGYQGLWNVAQKAPNKVGLKKNKNGVEWRIAPRRREGEM